MLIFTDWHFFWSCLNVSLPCGLLSAFIVFFSTFINRLSSLTSLTLVSTSHTGMQFGQMCHQFSLTDPGTWLIMFSQQIYFASRIWNEKLRTFYSAIQENIHRLINNNNNSGNCKNKTKSKQFFVLEGMRSRAHIFWCFGTCLSCYRLDRVVGMVL